MSGAVKTMTKRAFAGRSGFTVVEVLLLLVMGTVVVAALHHVLLAQNRFYDRERAATDRHDALRLAASVLSGDLREANTADGDIGGLGDDSLTVRAPVGFGIVCAADSTNEILGLTDTSGRLSATSGDSLLIYHPDGWLVRTTLERDVAESSLDCPYGSGPTLETTLRVNGSVAGVPVGAPLRAFHRRTYRLVQDDDEWWLARRTGPAVEVLAGPFTSSDLGGLAFSYVDSLGGTTTDPAEVARIDLMLVAKARSLSPRHDTLRVSVTPRNR